MSNGTAGRRVGPEHPDPDPPLADWLVALSHDSPFGQPPVPAAAAGSPPTLAELPSLLSLLRDADRGVRFRVVSALGDLAGEIRRVLPAIRAALGEAALHDGDDGVRAQAVHALLQAGPQPATAVGGLVDALHSELDVVRFHAAIALGDLGTGGRPTVPDLIHASLWDEDPAVRVGAAMALWKIDQKGPLAIYVLTDALRHPNELICWVAAEYLGQMGPAAGPAVPALREALRRDFRLALVRTGVRLALERIDLRPPVGLG
jgi:HEAT repeat protein